MSDLTGTTGRDNLESKISESIEHNHRAGGQAGTVRGVGGRGAGGVRGAVGVEKLHLLINTFHVNSSLF